MPVVALICALFLIAATPALAQPTPLRVVLTPSAANGEIDRLGVELRFRELPVAAYGAEDFIARCGRAAAAYCDPLPGFAAANAGDLQDEPNKLMEMVNERDGERRPITYAPRGAEVEAWRRERVADVLETQCRL